MPAGSARLASFMLACVAAALALNRDALGSFFSGDDLDTLSWATFIDLKDFLSGLVSPVYHPNNFRPVGALLYRIIGLQFGLDYRAFAIAIQTIHVLNIGLLVALLNRLGCRGAGIGAAAVFILFHPATVDAYWNFMYVFDALCATFWLLTLILYCRGNWALGIATCWLGYKSKELALMLPLILTAYELWFGQRQWLRLIPYYSIALLFGVQIALSNTARDDVYTLRFSANSLLRCIEFYGTETLLLPFGALLLIAAGLLLRDKLAWLGAVAFVAALLPMLLLPGRLHSMYLYVPLLGASMIVASIARRIGIAATCALAAAWMWFAIGPVQQRQEAFSRTAQENRRYFDAVRAFASQHREVKGVVYTGVPAGLSPWGVEAAARLAFGLAIPVYTRLEDAGNGAVAVVTWQPGWDAPQVRLHPK